MFKATLDLKGLWVILVPQASVELPDHKVNREILEQEVLQDTEDHQAPREIEETLVFQEVREPQAPEESAKEEHQANQVFVHLLTVDASTVRLYFSH